MGWTEERAGALAETFAGAFEGTGVRVAAAAVDETGAALRGDRPDEERFELGSVTKTMTGTLLAVLVNEGVVRLGDPVGRWLDAGRNAGLSLLSLATHTSGLPRLAPTHEPGGAGGPYGRFTAERAEEGLRRATPRPAAGYAYSNFGYQLLGLALERAAGLSYPALLAGRVLAPLGMRRSGVGAGGDGRRVTGHARGRPVPRWEQPLPAAGGAEATIADLARYVAACVRPGVPPLGDAVALAAAPHVTIDDRRGQGLGWHVHDGLRWHDGDTGGFSAAVAIDPAARRGVAVLAATSDGAGMLQEAAFLAVTGGDPRSLRARTLDSAWADRARAVAGALMEERPDDVRAAMTAGLRDRVSAGQLTRLWWMSTLDAGPVRDVAVTARRAGRLVACEVTVDLARRRLHVAISFDDAGQVADLRIRRAARPAAPAAPAAPAREGVPGEDRLPARDDARG